MDAGRQHSSPMHPDERENKERQDILEKEDRRKKNIKKLLHLKLKASRVRDPTPAQARKQSQIAEMTPKE